MAHSVVTQTSMAHSNPVVRLYLFKLQNSSTWHLLHLDSKLQLSFPANAGLGASEALIWYEALSQISIAMLLGMHLLLLCFLLFSCNQPA